MVISIPHRGPLGTRRSAGSWKADLWAECRMGRDYALISISGKDEDFD